MVLSGSAGSAPRPTVPLEELAPQFASPDLYQLAGRDVRVTYQPTFLGGLPHLTYQDRHRTLQFRGDEIRQVEVADLGLLISVTLVLSVDSGSTTFTLVLPHVNLPDQVGASSPIECVAAVTIHRVSPAPVFELGQRESYSAVRLTGTASLVILPL